MESQFKKEIDEFLARGGTITELPPQPDAPWWRFTARLAHKQELPDEEIIEGTDSDTDLDGFSIVD
jgi:hypothetical protein